MPNLGDIARNPELLDASVERMMRMSEDRRRSSMTIDELVQRIHATPTKAVIVITGGGLEALPLLTARGGASNTLISAIVPYDPDETVALIGGKPDKIVSEEVARSLAMVAYQRARARIPDGPVVGVAMTNILQRVPEERAGRQHAIYAALQTESETVAVTLEYDPADVMVFTHAGAIRAREESAAAMVLLNLLAEGCGLTDRVAISTEFRTDVRRQSSTDVWTQAFRDPTMIAFMNQPNKPNQSFAFSVAAGGHGPAISVIGANMHYGDRVVMPGSFNPAHDAHFVMARIAEEITGERCVFEITMRNADKPTLDHLSLRSRLMSIARGDQRKVLLTSATTFVQKAALMPNTTFVIGYDTATRIVDPRYYGHGGVDMALDELQSMGARFLVFGRTVDGIYRSELHPAVFPAAFRDMCQTVPDFRMDVSSTAIRNTNA